MSSQVVETRTRILQATVRMLEEHGGKGVRMTDIAKESGVSRQAVYLHFASRTELLVAATRYLDEILDVDSRLAPSRAATSGAERLARYIECWGNYIPDIYSVAKALLLARESQAGGVEWQALSVVGISVALGSNAASVTQRRSAARLTSLQCWVP